MASQEQHRRYAPGEVIIHDGDCGNNFFLIESGSVEVFKRTGTGHKLVIGRIPTGGIFGEMAVIDGDKPLSQAAGAARSFSVSQV